jgi:glycosidase
MPVNGNKDQINVERQDRQTDSILNYFRVMTSLRKTHPTLTYGSYLPIEVGNEKTFTYFRESEKEKYQIVLNFSDESSTFPFDQIGERLIGNYSDRSNELRPWEAMILINKIS